MTSAFKEFEHSAWESAAEHYDVGFSRLTRQVIPSFLSVLNIQAGSSLLDVACGPGYLAAAAKERGAQATGVDFSVPMVSRAKRLHPGIDFKEGDAEDLKEHADQYYDSVAINFGLLHLDQPVKALQEAYRVLKPGGRVAFTVWCLPEKAKGFTLVLNAVERFGDAKVPLPPAPPFFHFSDPSNVFEAFTRSGFEEGQTKIVDQVWEFEKAEDLFEAFLKGTARTGGLLRLQKTEQLRVIRESIYQEAEKYRQGDKISIPMPAHLAWAKKPVRFQ